MSTPVRVWAADLDEVPVDDSSALLSPGERERAARAGTDLVRRRFVARRILLRRLLGEVTGVAPGRLVLEQRCARCTKLHPAPLFAAARTHWWSMSSTGPRVMVAAAPWPLGVDIERAGGHDGWPAIARRYFASGEATAIGGDLRAFLRSWTLKEAYLKALGLGLAGGLDALDCTALAEDAGGWLRACAHPMWLFRSVGVDADHIAAVAVRGAPAHTALAVDTITPQRRAS